MSGLVNKETHKSVEKYIEGIKSKSKKEDAKILLAVMQEITGYEPKIWGNNFIIGFGKYKYKRKNGKEELEWFNVGFAPRSTKLSIYLTFDVSQEKAILDKLGKCKWGKGCLYINKLADVDLDVLKQLIEKSKTLKWH